MTQPAAFWDRHAQRYARRPIKNMAAYEETLAHVTRHLTPADRAIELGCGTGTTALLLADSVAHLTGTDISGGMIEIARGKAAAQHVENVDFKVSDADAEGFDTGAFDAVLAFNLIHLLPDPRQAALTARRLLKPGGLFLSKTPCLAHNTVLLRPLVWVLRKLGIAPAVTFLSHDGLEQAIAAAGFEILETGLYPTKSTSRFIVARRLGDH
ncbi:class I SAM-dependent methyltransferase [Sedimentitalea sp. JM2-8]|uniref:Class I SAM-dependent methyltransferase n=1 Tax=Sedimentitalea xiamensis TaxID=3050037 RepID=A0ABT7FKX1_9RHOB|nr:class I SAM-dependent methyltransferase [Sedimentitalea xiamensis]MDK3075790.1 class I SAM-dependent methyltransferase [Sedimentitalea xiamensis]